MCDAIVLRSVVEKDVGAGIEKIKETKCHPPHGR
jgi:hypothetical protein